MSEHSVAEAKDQLSSLIDRALRGEGVVITRQGRPVVELTPIPISKSPRQVTAEDVEWLAAHRVGGSPSEDAGVLVSWMRDEEDEK